MYLAPIFASALAFLIEPPIKSLKGQYRFWAWSKQRQKNLSLLSRQIDDIKDNIKKIEIDVEKNSADAGRVAALQERLGGVHQQLDHHWRPRSPETMSFDGQVIYARLLGQQSAKPGHERSAKRPDYRLTTDRH